MPAKRGTPGKPAAGRGRYQKSSLSPSRGNASPKKGRADKDDSKDMAVILEKERKSAKKAMRDFAEQTLEGLSLGSIDVDLSVREGCETLCRDYLQWLDMPVGDKAKTDEYNMKLGEMKGSLERALELTEIKRQEPPLPLNIFDHDHIIIADSERQVESAIKNASVAELKRLLSLQRGRALLNKKDEAGWSSLHHAVATGNDEIVSVILREGADVNQDNHLGWAPIHMACAHGRVAALPLLISNGAQLDAVTRQPPEWTPLHFAAANGELEAVDLLIKGKADTNAKAAGAWTPLHLASMNGHTSVAVALMWGNKEEMTNGADNALGLETRTGNGEDVVSGLVGGTIASCHLQIKTQSQITAAMLRVKDEHTRRALAAKEQAAKKKKKKPAGSGPTTPLTASSPLRSAAGSTGTGRGGEDARDAGKGATQSEEDRSAPKSKSPAHSKSPTRTGKQSPPKSRSPAQSKSPTRKPK
jgi:hypothetical protein